MASKNTLFEQGEHYDYSYAEGEPDSYETLSYIGGKKRVPKKKTAPLKKKKVKKGIFGNIGSNFRKAQAVRKKQKAVEAKNTASAIKAMSKPDAPIKLPPMPKIKKDKGMSMGAKIGIGVGILAILGIGAYFIIKKK